MAGSVADQGGSDRATGASPTDGDGTDATFRGVTELSLDAKGRLAIPARYRDGLVNGSGGELVLCPALLTRAWQVAGSHDGGDTS